MINPQHSGNLRIRPKQVAIFTGRTFGAYGKIPELFDPGFLVADSYYADWPSKIDSANTGLVSGFHPIIDLPRQAWVELIIEDFILSYNVGSNMMKSWLLGAIAHMSCPTGLDTSR